MNVLKSNLLIRTAINRDRGPHRHHNAMRVPHRGFNPQCGTRSLGARPRWLRLLVREFTADTPTEWAAMVGELLTKVAHPPRAHFEP